MITKDRKQLIEFLRNHKVKVRLDNPDSPTRRTPSYVRGKTGIIRTCYGTVIDPEFDRDHRVSWGPLYTVEFDWSELYENEEPQDSKIFVDLHESWLEEL